jgi:hypothetical protein
MPASVAGFILTLAVASAYADDGWSPGKRVESSGACETGDPMYGAVHCPAQENPCVLSDGMIVFKGWYRDVAYTSTRGTRVRMVYTSKTRANGTTALSVPYLYGSDYVDDERFNGDMPAGSTIYFQIRIIRQSSAPAPTPTLPPPPGTIGTGKDWFSTFFVSTDGAGNVRRGAWEPRNECRGRTKWDHDRNHWEDD